MSVYEKFEVEKINGEKIPLSKYSGKVTLTVNTASKCQFTYQYEQLQDLYERYKDLGFEILGFPCNQFDNQEPGSSEEVQEFCPMVLLLIYLKKLMSMARMQNHYLNI